jgi:hypothetical protein
MLKAEVRPNREWMRMRIGRSKSVDFFPERNLAQSDAINRNPLRGGFAFKVQSSGNEQEDPPSLKLRRDKSAFTKASARQARLRKGYGATRR